jgi:hypothetical protein
VLFTPSDGTFNSFGPIRGAFKSRKRGQGAAAKASRTPYVVVVSTANSPVPVGAFELMVGMFGGPRRLSPGQNTRFSALVVVSAFNPTMWRVERELDARDRAGRNLQQQLSDSARVIEERTVAGEFDPVARIARLEVVHNPWAAVPLAIEVFGGPHDRQHTFDTTTRAGGLQTVWEGWRIHEVPKTEY